MNEEEYDHCIFNAMNIITLHPVAPRLLQTSCKMTGFPWTDPQLGLYQEAPRQLWALQEDCKGSQWDSSEKEFPEENRLTQGIKKHCKTTLSVFLTEAAACIYKRYRPVLQKPAQDYGLTRVDPCLGRFLQKGHGQKGRQLSTNLWTKTRFFRSFIIMQCNRTQ